MQVFGKNIQVKNIENVEPKVDLMELINILISNIYLKYHSNPYVQNIKETLSENSVIKIYSSGIVIEPVLNENLTGKHIDKCNHIYLQRYFYDYNKDSFCTNFGTVEVFPNVGLLNV